VVDSRQNHVKSTNDVQWSNTLTVQESLEWITDQQQPLSPSSSRPTVTSPRLWRSLDTLQDQNSYTHSRRQSCSRWTQTDKDPKHIRWCQLHTIHLAATNTKKLCERHSTAVMITFHLLHYTDTQWYIQHTLHRLLSTLTEKLTDSVATKFYCVHTLAVGNKHVRIRQKKTRVFSLSYLSLCTLSSYATVLLNGVTFTVSVMHHLHTKQPTTTTTILRP